MNAWKKENILGKERKKERKKEMLHCIYHWHFEYVI